MIDGNYDRVPECLIETNEYKNANIREVILKAIELDINLRLEYNLIWIARMALAFPLPPNWIEY